MGEELSIRYGHITWHKAHNTVAWPRCGRTGELKDKIAIECPSSHLRVIISVTKITRYVRYSCEKKTMKSRHGRQAGALSPRRWRTMHALSVRAIAWLGDRALRAPVFAVWKAPSSLALHRGSAVHQRVQVRHGDAAAPSGHSFVVAHCLGYLWAVACRRVTETYRRLR